MRCTFQVDGDDGNQWTDERELPLYPGEIVTHADRDYEITDGPQFTADIESASVREASWSKRRQALAREGDVVLVHVDVQVVLGFAAHSVAGLGWLHGPNALVLFGLALYSARRSAGPRPVALAHVGSSTE